MSCNRKKRLVRSVTKTLFGGQTKQNHQKQNAPLQYNSTKRRERESYYTGGIAGGLFCSCLTYLQHLGEPGQDLVLEKNRAVTVGLEVHPHVVLVRLVVDELNAGLRHGNAHAVGLEIPAEQTGHDGGKRQRQRQRQSRAVHNTRCRAFSQAGEEGTVGANAAVGVRVTVRVRANRRSE